jgi:hypothetical protein
MFWFRSRGFYVTEDSQAPACYTQLLPNFLVLIMGRGWVVPTLGWVGVGSHRPGFASELPKSNSVY